MSHGHETGKSAAPVEPAAAVVRFAWSRAGPFPCLVARSERGVCLSSIGDEGALERLARWRDAHAAGADIVEDAGALASAVRQLDLYFRGESKTLDVELDLRGTDFQKRVWLALRTIPHGATRTYGDIAREIGIPGAVRAVGAANGRNPVPPFVPCHRVVASNGIGGFTGGLSKKRALLALESAQVFFA
jgi:methylated-DNA-[protein]-cysteine S-methyltransferase